MISLKLLFLLYASSLLWVQIIMVWGNLKNFTDLGDSGVIWGGAAWEPQCLYRPRWSQWESGDGLCFQTRPRAHSWRIMFFYFELCSASVNCYLPATCGTVPQDHQQAGLLIPEQPPSKPSSPNLPLFTPTSWLKFIPIHSHPMSKLQTEKSRYASQFASVASTLCRQSWALCLALLPCLSWHCLSSPHPPTRLSWLLQQTPWLQLTHLDYGVHFFSLTHSSY